MKNKLIIILFSVFCISAYAQDPVIVRASVDTTKALIGQTIHVKVEMSQPRNLKVDWYQTDTLEQLEIISRSEIDTVNTTDQNILLRSQDYTVSAYDSGLYTIPSFTFSYKVPGNDKEFIASSDPLKVEFYLVPVDTTKAIHDILPVKEVPYDWTFILLIAGGCLVLLVIAYFIYRYFKNRPVQEKVEVPVPVITRPAHEIALEALKALEDQKQWQQGHVKLYYTILTDILRQYIFNRWNINAMEMTSDEILSNGFMNLLKSEEREMLGFILKLADLVKFAKVKPLASEHEQSMRYAYHFVQHTIPQPVMNEKSKAEVQP